MTSNCSNTIRTCTAEKQSLPLASPFELSKSFQLQKEVRGQGSLTRHHDSCTIRRSSELMGIRRAISSYKILAHTSFVIQPGFADFVAQNSRLIRDNPILMPHLVFLDLKRFLSSGNPAKRNAAKRTLRILTDLSNRGHFDIRGETSDKHIDLVIRRVVEQNLTNYNFMVLTNDVKLMEDLYSIRQNKSLDKPRKLLVIKLYGASQKPEVFSPDRSYGTRADTSPVTSSIPSKPFAIKRTLVGLSNTKLVAHDVLGSGSRVRMMDGQGVTLGKELAKGGEGAVFEIIGRNEVCKIYHAHKLTLGRQQKMQLMLTRRLTDPAICWPQTLVLDRHKTFRGYVMSRAFGRPLAHSLFTPKPWLQKHSDWNRRRSVRLSISIVKHIMYLHQQNVLLGDINPLNILLKDEATQYLVDTDSYQIEGFPCPVGTVNFTPPEIQGADFRTFLRSPEHELFAVATLIFMILMPGKSPYSHQGGESGYSNIKQMHFPYPLGENHSKGVPLGPWRFCWSHLSYDIKEGFHRSFHSDYRYKPRVKLGEWLSLLRDYEEVLNLPGHSFHGPKRRIGFDLSILPQNLRIVASQTNIPKDDGRTDMQKELLKLKVASAGKISLGRSLPSMTRMLSGRIPVSCRRLSNGYSCKQIPVAPRHTIRPGASPKKAAGFFSLLKGLF